MDIDTGTGAEGAPASATEAAPAAPLSVEAAVAAYAQNGFSTEPTASAPEQPRGPDGQFIPKANDAEVVTPPAEAAPAAAPPADDDDDDAPPPPAEAPKEGEEEEQPAPEGEDGEAFVLKVHARRDGEEDVELEFTGLDKETRERLAQMRNEAMRGSEYRERITVVESREHQLADIYAELAEDPGTFLSAKVHPSMRKEAALAILDSLMDQPGIYDEIVDTLNTWETDAATRAAARQEREEAANARRVDPEVRQNLTEIRNTVAAWVPDGADPEQAKQFQQEAFAVLLGIVQARRLETLDVAKIPSFITALAQEYGYNAPAPAGAPPASKPADAAPAPAVPAEKIEAAKDTGRKLVSASARRREVTAVSPAGPGAAPQSGLNPPPGQSVEERIAWYSQQ